MKKLIILSIILSPLFVCGQSETINVSGHGEGLFINNSADSAGTYITLTDYNGKRADIVSFDDMYPGNLYSNTLTVFARNGKDMRFATSTDAGAGANRLVIKNNGLIGVGTDNPVAGFHMNKVFIDSNGTRFAAILGNAWNDYTYFGGPTAGRIRGSTSGYLVVESNPNGSGDKRLYLNSGSPGDISIGFGGGNVGIGKNTPSAKLDIEALGDGVKLLQFSMDRAWAFQQEGSGTSTSLALNVIELKKENEQQEALIQELIQK